MATRAELMREEQREEWTQAGHGLDWAVMTLTAEIEKALKPLRASMEEPERDLGRTLARETEAVLDHVWTLVRVIKGDC